MQIQPITNDADLDAALRRIDAIIDAPDGSPEAHELDALGSLVHAYETRRYPLAKVDPIEMLLFVMAQKGLSRADIEPCFGSRARVSEVLSRKRPLTLGMIRKLHNTFGISASLLVDEYALAG